MRIAWVVPDADIRIASFRYRCLIPAWALQQRGHDSTIFVDVRPDPTRFDALVVVKQAGGGLDALARSFEAQGKPVFLDLCDNIFVPGYAQRRGPGLSPETASDLVRHAAGFVTPTESLARIAREHLGADAGSWVVPDAAITTGIYQALSAWLDGVVVALKPTMMDRITSVQWLGFGTNPEEDLARDKQQEFNVESDWGADQLPNETARVIWFGRHGSFHSKFGMSLLQPVIEELEQIHRDRPVELVIISNNRIKFDAMTYGSKIFTRYEAWSNERVFFELSRANLFVMPSGSDPFSLCKSANRAVLSLVNGVPVVANHLESLEPLRDVIVQDDWRTGIEAYLLNPAIAKNHVTRAQPIIEAEFSVDAIARRWNDALRGVSGLSAPKARWQAEAQEA